MRLAAPVGLAALFCLKLRTRKTRHRLATDIIPCLVRVKPEGVDRSRSGLDYRDSNSFPPVPDVGRALTVRADRTEQPTIGAEVQTADLRDS